MTLMSLREEYNDQTEIRLQLLRNGYRPLPTAEKVAFQKGWPSMTVDERAIRSWPMTIVRERTTPAVTTAIQLTGTMLAIDIDVQDAEVSDEILMYALEMFGDDRDWVPIRDSGGAKVMILCRTEEPYNMWKTPKYIDADGRDHMVEVYGGASTRYFSCFGPHTLGGITNGQYEVVKRYHWDGDSPLNIRPEELPVITQKQLDNFLTVGAADTLAATGWEKVKNSRGGEFEAGVAYDLTEDMIFDTADGPLTYWEAVSYAAYERDARCSSSFLGDGGSNTQKCRMRALGMSEDDAGLSIFDHETWTHHLPLKDKPRTTEEQMDRSAALGAALRRVMPDEVQRNLQEAMEQGADVEEFEAAVDFMLDNLAFNTMTGAIHYLDKRTGIWAHVSYATVKGAYAHLDLSWTGPKGGLRRYSPVDAWRACDDKLKVAGVRFNPKTEDRVFHNGSDNETYANGFFGLPAVDAEVEQEDVDLMHDFLCHLVPDEDEREWLLDWLAAKYQQPWERNCAVLFVAPGVQGAGRGTFFSILDNLFNGYTTSVSESDLLGARFNSFMENNLLVFCNELGGLGWSERKRGYETLKDRVDPSHNVVHIERKGVEAYRTTTYVSFMLATNQPGALTIDAEDRRFAIITNGSKLEGELLQRIIATGTQALAHALAHIVKDRTVLQLVSDAPMFAGREQMLTANETELDATIAKIIRSAPEWRAWVRSSFEQAIKLEMTGSSNGKVPGLRQAVSNLVGERAKRFGAELLPKLLVGDQRLVVVAKSGSTFEALPADERAKVVEGKAPDWEATNVVPLK